MQHVDERHELDFVLLQPPQPPPEQFEDSSEEEPDTLEGPYLAGILQHEVGDEGGGDVELPLDEPLWWDDLQESLWWAEVDQQPWLVEWWWLASSPPPVSRLS